MSVNNDILLQIPSPGEFLEKVEFVDIDSGITLTRLGPEESARWFSAIQAQTTAGPVGLQFEIKDPEGEIISLQRARALWRPCAQAAAKEFDSRLQESQRRIIVPGREVPLP